MLDSLLALVANLQGSGVLPQGEYSHRYWEQPASYICYISLGDGYYIKKSKVRDGAIEKEQIVIKEQFERESSVLEMLSPIFSTNAIFHVPELVFSDSKEQVIITKALRGSSFESICNNFATRIGSKTNNAPDYCNNVGQFLRFLHASKREPFTASDLDYLLNYIRTRISTEDFTVRQIKKIDNFLMKKKEEIVQDIGKYEKCIVHHDLNPTNILAADNYLGVLDFADSKLDMHFQDFVYFQLMLIGQLGSKIKYKTSLKKMLLSAFQEGYGMTNNSVEKNPLFLLYQLKNISIFLISTNSLLNNYTLLSFSLKKFVKYGVLKCDIRKYIEAIMKIVNDDSCL